MEGDAAVGSSRADQSRAAFGSARSAVFVEDQGRLPQEACSDVFQGGQSGEKLRRSQVEKVMAHVVEIFIATSPTTPATSVDRARAIPGQGLEGDRYANGLGTFSKHPQQPDGELTLIQEEHIDDFAKGTGVPFAAGDARRNIVTSGIDLNTLVGREFTIGEV